jgi:hypothetical protein
VQDDGKPLKNGWDALLLLFDPCLMLQHEQAHAWTAERHLNAVQYAFVCGLERMRWQYSYSELRLRSSETTVEMLPRLSRFHGNSQCDIAKSESKHAELS